MATSATRTYFGAVSIVTLRVRSVRSRGSCCRFLNLRSELFFERRLVAELEPRGFAIDLLIPGWFFLTAGIGLYTYARVL